MNQLNKALIHWSFPIILTLLMFSSFLVGEFDSDQLSYQLVPILNGEYWRLITAHLVHLNDNHLYLNSVGLLLIWSLVGDRFKLTEWLGLTLLLGVMVSFGLLVFNPDLQYYVGLSGVLHGLLIAGVLKQFSSYEELALVVVVVVKLLYEQIYGPLSGSEEMINGNVIVDAHLYGALAGVVYVFIRRALFK